MKTKTIFMLAAMLLMSMGAFAQSNEPLEGDVNKDGKVDVADIVKIIDIMQNSAPQPAVTYYWYVGLDSPVGMDPDNYDTHNGLNEWTNLGSSLPTTDIKVAKSDDTNWENHTWYIAAPTDANFTLYNANNVASDETAFWKTTFNVGSVSYTLWTSKSEGWQAVNYLHK